MLFQLWVSHSVQIYGNIIINVNHSLNMEVENRGLFQSNVMPLVCRGRKRSRKPSVRAAIFLMGTSRMRIPNILATQTFWEGPER
jgi:hypothetical protein